MTSKQIKMTLENDVAVLTFDSPESKLNTLNHETLKEISSLLDEINHDDTIKAVLIISGKEDNFIAGADIHEFEKMSGKNARALTNEAHVLLNKISRSKKPFGAAIHGACLGGGLEVVLACHYRIATKDEITQFGSPEVLLGLVPAAGGTQRLPRIIGLKNALELLLSGKRINTKKARALGLVDFSLRTLEELKPSAIGFMQKASQKALPKKNKKLYFWSLLQLYFAKRLINKKTHGHYPAPLAIIDIIKTGIIKGFTAGLKKESQEFGRLIEGQVCKNLIRLFFAQKSHQKMVKFDKSEENLIGIIGSGLMGSGIATVSLLHGQKVYLNDSDPNALAKAQSHVYAELKNRVSRGKISSFVMRRYLSHLSAPEDLEKLSYCNLIIEAIVEDLEVKQKILANCESIMTENCIFASNTSSIPISEIAKNSPIKDRIIGMHYFSPVEKMPLLEIVKTKETSDSTLKKAVQIGSIQGKTIIIVNDSPGFYTTRIISALFDEACALLIEGHDPKEIDNQLVTLGFPMGPLALMDQVGLDIGYHVADVLLKRLGRRLVSVDLGIYKSLIDANFLGRKSHKGFYIYNNHKKSINSNIKNIIEPYKNKTHLQNTDEDLGQRMLLRMVNEAAICLAEEVIESEEDGDVGAVFGVGFPPYLGGPFQYIKDQGEAKISKELQKLYDLYGERFSKNW